MPEIQIRLTNSMTRTKEPFVPLDPGNVRMYVCGPTVYDRAHLGNARAVVVFDVLYRLLRHVYGEGHVTYVRNITDVDDKIIAAAQERRDAGDPRRLNDIIAEITATTSRWYADDMAALGALPPTHEPRATGHIAHMVALIETLIARGHAYLAQGHVLFSVASDPDYGRLSGRSTEDMIAGARVEVAPYKGDPMDFVLWKPSTPDQPGWPSPWGRGRPGWHIECSAMSRDLLGPSFDIHGGGTDLLFPHHENEIAQSHAAGDPLARVWLHNEMLQVEGKKMSKSLGNFFTVRDLLDQGIPGEVIRLVFLQTHYRSPMDWTERKAREATKTLDAWAEGFTSEAERVRGDMEEVATELARYQYLLDEPSKTQDAPEELVQALADDLNTSLATTILRKIGNQIRRIGESDEEHERGEVVVRTFLAGCELLGVNFRTYTRAYLKSERFMSSEERDDLGRAWVNATINALLAERLTARQGRDFARADSLRDAIVAAGVVIMDRPDGPTAWRLGPDFDAAKLETLR